MKSALLLAVPMLLRAFPHPSRTLMEDNADAEMLSQQERVEPTSSDTKVSLIQELSAGMQELFGIAEKLAVRTKSMEEQMTKLASDQQTTANMTLELEAQATGFTNFSAQLGEVEAEATHAFKSATAINDQLSEEASKRQEMQKAIHQVQEEVDQQSAVSASLAQVTQDLAESFTKSLPHVIGNYQTKLIPSSSGTPVTLMTQPVQEQVPVRPPTMPRLADMPMVSKPTFSKPRSLARRMPVRLPHKAAEMTYPGLQMQA